MQYLAYEGYTKVQLSCGIRPEPNMTIVLILNTLSFFFRLILYCGKHWDRRINSSAMKPVVNNRTENVRSD
jgi:hypothetical protein